MANPTQTISEALFEEFCGQQGFRYQRVPRQPRSQAPDYDVLFGHRKVIVEVKECTPNAQDREYAETLERDGLASQCRDPDHVADRLRNFIKKSRRQLCNRIEQSPSNTPAVLIVFDAARNGYTDPYAIQTAMFGWEQVTVEVPPAGGSPRTVGRGFGERNNAATRPDKNTHLSAIATLDEWWHIETHQRQLSLRFFHNPEAQCPLPDDLWQGELIDHFGITDGTPGEFQGWTKMPSTAS